MRILLTISYDGTPFSGWQRQKNAISVEAVLETALSNIFSKYITVTGAGRTDKGVHALGQKATFELEDLKIPLDKLPQVINRDLSDSVVVTNAVSVPDTFHPRYDAVKKTYEYRIYTGKYPNPLYRAYSCHIPYSLDFERMEQALRYFLGTHDFTAFCAAACDKENKVRTIHEVSLERKEDMIIMTVCGNGFLYNMVRIIAGTIIFVGAGKIKPENIPGIIDSRDRKKAGKTAIAQGLTLVSVEYDENDIAFK